jgi:prepilin-type N-terminal cleavage/methylation domain-containing protein/prepilin-type processing-associated H-X9-DG protein
MRTISFNGRAAGFTLLELLCVILIISLLAALLLPVYNQARARAQVIGCVEHLHQVGIGFHSFAHDHNGLFPMAVPAAAGGALEFVQRGYLAGGDFYFAYRQFQALSNELVSPRLLVCPADTRQPAANFSLLQNSNTSYFVAVTAQYSQPASLLAGDANLTSRQTGQGSFVRLGLNAPLRWTRDLHQFKGNLLYADGRVVERKTPGFMAANLPGTALFFPTLPPASTLSAVAQTGTHSAGARPTGLGAVPPDPSQSLPFAANLSSGPATTHQLSMAAQTTEGASSSPTAPAFKPAGPAAPGPAGAAATAPPEPQGVSTFFPPWIGSLARILITVTGLFWYLGLVLVMLALLWARQRLQKASSPNKGTGPRVES